jgi:hypothetical protein
MATAPRQGIEGGIIGAVNRSARHPGCQLGCGCSGWTPVFQLSVGRYKCQSLLLSRQSPVHIS